MLDLKPTLVELCAGFAIVLATACSSRHVSGSGTEPVVVHPSHASRAVDAAVADATSASVPADDECEPYDIRNPACARYPKMCFHGGYCKCPSPPDVENPACWATMPCPAVPDHRVRACRPHVPSCPDHPHCAQGPVVARVLSYRDGVISIAAGRVDGVRSGWTATLLRSDSDVPLDGGWVEIVRVELRVSVGRVRLPEHVVVEHPRVRLVAP